MSMRKDVVLFIVVPSVLAVLLAVLVAVVVVGCRRGFLGSRGETNSLNDIGLGAILVINMRHRKDRLRHIEWQFKYVQLPFQRIDAVNGRDYLELRSTLHRESVCHVPSLLLLTGDKDTMGPLLGCWQSHLNAYFRIRDDAATEDKPVLILEDDVEFGTDFPQALQNALQAVQAADPKWDILFMGWCGDPTVFGTRAVAKDVWKANAISCAHAYVVHNRATAMKLISLGNSRDVQVADVFWLHAFAKSFHTDSPDGLAAYIYTTQPFVVQAREKFGSDIPTSLPIATQVVRFPIPPPPPPST